MVTLEGDKSSNLNAATIELIMSDPLRMAALEAAAQLDLNDWLIGAGFVRNLIWDHLHHFVSNTLLNDVDLLYLDASDPNPKQTEIKIARHLRHICPQVKWEVRNQARMHLKHGVHPYQRTLDAVADWIELPTCVAVKFSNTGQVSIFSPYGLEHNWSLEVRINPHAPTSPSLFHERITAKQWRTIWPQLNIIWP